MGQLMGHNGLCSRKLPITSYWDGIKLSIYSSGQISFDAAFASRITWKRIFGSSFNSPIQWQR